MAHELSHENQVVAAPDERRSERMSKDMAGELLAVDAGVVGQAGEDVPGAPDTEPPPRALRSRAGFVSAPGQAGRSSWTQIPSWTRSSGCTGTSR